MKTKTNKPKTNEYREPVSICLLRDPSHVGASQQHLCEYTQSWTSFDNHDVSQNPPSQKEVFPPHYPYAINPILPFFLVVFCRHTPSVLITAGTHTSGVQ